MDDIGKIRPERAEHIEDRKAESQITGITPGLLILYVSTGVLVAGLLLWALNEGYERYKHQQMVEKANAWTSEQIAIDRRRQQAQQDAARRARIQREREAVMAREARQEQWEIQRRENLLRTEAGTVQLAQEQLASAQAKEKEEQCLFWKGELRKANTAGNRAMVTEWCE